MEYRLRKKGDDTFRLIDPMEVVDTSSWGRTYDGTVNVCRESVYTFLRHVVRAVKSMYKEAGLWNPQDPPYLHIGGDETPSYTWQMSPLCDQLYRSNPELNSREDLFPYFIKRYAKIVDEEGFRVIAWEEAFIRDHFPVDPEELELTHSARVRK